MKLKTKETKIDNQVDLNKILSKNESDKKQLVKIKKWFIVRVVTFLIISLICLVSLFFASSIESLINFDYFASSVLEPKQSKIHFIDVGQGDCSVIQLPNGEIAMIDTGAKDKWNKINTYFEFLKIPKKIDYLILTHTDNDHVGNAEKILEHFEVNSVYIPKVYSNYELINNLAVNSAYKVFDDLTWNNICAKIHTKIKEENINYNEKGLVIENETKSFSINFLSPFEDYYEDDNNYSPIIWCNLSFQQALFMGDVDNKLEKQFLKEYETAINKNLFKITILKVGHHGSKSSTSIEFLEKIKPHLAVISCGKDNAYGHPADETINALNTVTGFTKTLRTDVNNSIMFFAEINNNGISYGVYLEYENFDNFYIKHWHIVITIVTLSFSIFILPLIANGKKQFEKLKKLEEKIKLNKEKK